MKKLLLVLATLTLALTASTGCSTTGQFKIPPDTRLEVTNRPVSTSGEFKTSPFFWTETAGAKYRLYDSKGTLLRSGKLKTHFRVVSIFWPPAAIIYWPMGLQSGEYDLTVPGDGYMVVDDEVPTAAKSFKKKKKTDTATDDDSK